MKGFEGEAESPSLTLSIPNAPLVDYPGLGLIVYLCTEHVLFCCALLFLALLWFALFCFGLHYFALYWFAVHCLAML